MRSGTRKGIGPVLATAILIAVILIAAVAIAGFVFGLLSPVYHGCTLNGHPITGNFSIPGSQTYNCKP